MKNYYYLFLSLLLANCQISSAQKTITSATQLGKNEIEGHIRFLASDELEGRNTGTRGQYLAARYIAEQFRLNGVQTAPNHDSYYQEFNLEEVTPPTSGEVKWHGETLNVGDKMLVMGGSAIEHEGEAIYVGYGLGEANGRNDYEGLDVKGKVVVVQIGDDQAPNPFGAIGLSEEKQRLAQEKGAVALIELYNLPIPWNLISGYLKGSRMQAESAQTLSIPTFWVNDGQKNILKKISESKTSPIQVQSAGNKVKKIKTQNIVGYIEGSDPKLKDEYILLTAHYDHVGVGKVGAQGVTPEDSIFNGARDNAVGTTAVLSAGKMLAKNPPARSVLLVTFTAEEKGLLGSKYYSDNPFLPLNKCIFNLNIDNGGYNDTSIVTVIGLERTGANDEIQTATAQFGLEAIKDPAPEQGLFDRSDNVNFASKGVPAPTFSLGFRAFDAEIGKYYHQVTDEAESLDFDYLLKYTQAYIYAAELIANKKEAPKWSVGDKYEEAAKALYEE